MSVPLLPSAIVKRIQKASAQDADLLARDRKDAEKHCLHRHSRRVWERLGRSERESIRKNVMLQNSKNTFLPMDDAFEEYECIRMVERVLEARKK